MIDREALYDQIPTAREQVERGLREAKTLDLKEAKNYLVLRKGLDRRFEVGVLFFAGSTLIGYTPLAFDGHPFETKYAARAALALQTEGKAVDGGIIFEYSNPRNAMSRQARWDLAESLQVFGVKVLDHLLLPLHQEEQEEQEETPRVYRASALS